MAAKKTTPRPEAVTPTVPKVARPLAPSVWTTWTVPAVRAALLAHELGDFSASAQLGDQLRRDDRIFATLDTRVLGALGLPYSTLPSDETDARSDAEKIARRVHSWWFRAFPESVLADVLRLVDIMGFAIGELLWHEEWVPTSRNLGVYELRPRLRIHHPQFVRHDATRDAWFLLTEEGEVCITPGDGRWVLFAHGTDRPWMNGALRALALPWLIRTFGRRDWARRSEIDGIGVKKAKTPASIAPEVLDKFLAQVRALGAESTLVLPDGYDFSIDANQLSAAEGFSRLIGACDTAITLALLGANLPTEAKSGGSFALGKVQAEAQLDRLEADVQMLGTVCREQIVKPWGRFNVERWADELAPWPFWDPTPPANLKDRAAALLTASQAITTLHRIGVEVTPVLEQFGLKVGPDGLRDPGGATDTVSPAGADPEPPVPDPAQGRDDENEEAS